MRCSDARSVTCCCSYITLVVFSAPPLSPGRRSCKSQISCLDCAAHSVGRVTGICSFVQRRHETPCSVFQLIAVVRAVFCWHEVVCSCCFFRLKLCVQFVPPPAFSMTMSGLRGVSGWGGVRGVQGSALRPSDWLCCRT